MGVAVIQLWCINLRHNTKLFFTSLSYNGHSQVVIIFDRIYNTYNFCIFLPIYLTYCLQTAHSSILARKIPQTEETGELGSMGVTK